MVHSTPRFPPVRQEGQFYYPSSGLTNGQNFICVTYPLDRFQTIGKLRDPLVAKYSSFTVMFKGFFEAVCKISSKIGLMYWVADLLGVY